MSGSSSIDTRPKKDNTLTLEMLEPLPPKTQPLQKSKPPVGHLTTTTATQGDNTAARVKPLSTNDAKGANRSQSNVPETQEAGVTEDRYAGRYDTITSLLNQFSLYSKKKRPAWDTRGRLEEMDDLMAAVYQFMHKEASNSQVESNEVTPLEVDHNTMSLCGTPRQLKRPARDTKLHVQEASTLIDTMHQWLRRIYKTSQALENTEQSDELQQEFQEISTNKLKTKKADIEVLLHQEHESKQRAQNEESQQAQDIQTLSRVQTHELEQLQGTEAAMLASVDNLSSKLRELSSKYDTQLSENNTLQSTVARQSSSCLMFEDENRDFKLKIKRTNDLIGQRDSTIASLESCVRKMDSEQDELVGKLDSDELTRAKLGSVIADMRGHIRVFCRVCPVDPALSLSKSKQAYIQYPDSEQREIVIGAVESTEWNKVAKGQSAFATGRESLESQKLSKSNSPTEQTLYPFLFDRVLQPNSTLDQLYNHIAPLIENIFSGTPLTILSIGSVQPKPPFYLENGLLPRIVLDVSQRCQELERSQGWQITVTIQRLGISSETLIDLFKHDRVGQQAGVQKEHASGNQGDNILDIQTEMYGSVAVSGLTTIALEHASVSASAITSILERSRTALSSISTSPCHSLFTLRVSGKRPSSSNFEDGSLSAVVNVAEVAGSTLTIKPDALSSSDTLNPALSGSLKPMVGSLNGTKGDPKDFSESQDTTMTNLLQVLQTLSSKESRIPFRGSKLTTLLMPSLTPPNNSGRKSGLIVPKVVMVAHISSLESQIHETLNTLRIAAKVNTCNIGLGGTTGSQGSFNGSNTHSGSSSSGSSSNTPVIVSSGSGKIRRT
ncbi:Kinesin-like protein kifc1 [Podila humilis]|nr:Kinesin-like protein kifc1 [Podila humilis]